MQTKTPDLGELGALLAAQKERFSAFEELLLFYNSRFNLTSITDPEEILHKHFLDSLAGEAYFPHGAAVAEVGSGAGFPSVPLMLVRGDLSFTLFESVGKKCEFLKTAVCELGLSAEVVCMRAEDAGKDPAFRERFSVSTARAVAKLNTLAEYCMPLVKKGGRFIAYKGAESELSLGKQAISVLGGEAVEIGYELPKGYGARTLVVAEKKRPTPPRYPRGKGAERRDPLV